MNVISEAVHTLLLLNSYVLSPFVKLVQSTCCNDTNPACNTRVRVKLNGGLETMLKKLRG